MKHLRRNHRAKVTLSMLKEFSHDPEFRKRFYKGLLTGLGAGGALCGGFALIGGPVGAGLGAAALIGGVIVGASIPVAKEFYAHRIQFDFETTEIAIADLRRVENADDDLSFKDKPKQFVGTKGSETKTEHVLSKSRGSFFSHAEDKHAKADLGRSDNEADDSSKPSFSIS
jgi:hypothetical protein